MVHNASQRKKIITSLKSNTEQFFASTSYQTIYHCIVIHQRQYIDMSTHVAGYRVGDSCIYIRST